MLYKLLDTHEKVIDYIENYSPVGVKWDILNCTNDTIYRFVFIPYYQENNPYEESDGTKIFHYYFDMTYYYWARSVGVIAFEGESLYVRKDQEAYKQCLLDAIRSYR